MKGTVVESWVATENLRPDWSRTVGGQQEQRGAWRRDYWLVRLRLALAPVVAAVCRGKTGFDAGALSRYINPCCGGLLGEQILVDRAVGERDVVIHSVCEGGGVVVQLRLWRAAVLVVHGCQNTDSCVRHGRVVGTACCEGLSPIGGVVALN